MLCACPCGKEFEPKRSNQVYFSAEHRRRDSNRRWPVKRQSLLPVSFRKGQRERQKAGTSYVTLHEGASLAQPKPRTLLWETRGKFGPEFVNGASRSVLKEHSQMKGKRDLPRVRTTVGFIRGPRLLTTEEAAQLLAIRPATLRWWRVSTHRSGPNFLRIGGRIRYAVGDINSYLMGRTVRVESGRSSGGRQ